MKSKVILITLVVLCVGVARWRYFRPEVGRGIDSPQVPPPMPAGSSESGSGRRDPNLKYGLADGSIYVAPSGRRYTVDNPWRQWHSTLYDKKDFLAIHQAAQNLLTQGTAAAHFELSGFYKALVDTPRITSFEDAESVLNAWLLKYPKQSTPWMLRGMLYAHWGWYVRGSGYTSEVDDKAAEKFLTLMEKAQADFQTAASRDPRDPNPWAQLVGCAKNLGLDRDVMEQRFDQALKCYPGHIRAHSMKWQYLRPRWYGKEGESEAFEQEIRQKLSQYPLLSVILENAHVEHHSDDMSLKWLERPDVWSEIQSSYTTAFREIPKWKAFHANYARVAQYANNLSVAREQLDALGDYFPVEAQISLEAYDELWSWAHGETAKGDVHFGGEKL